MFKKFLSADEKTLYIQNDSEYDEFNIYEKVRDPLNNEYYNFKHSMYMPRPKDSSEVVPLSENDYKCKECKIVTKLENMLIKTNGLACPHCNLILVQPINKIYRAEIEKRK